VNYNGYNIKMRTSVLSGSCAKESEEMVLERQDKDEDAKNARNSKVMICAYQAFRLGTANMLL
jgi:hypothetical protein